MRKIIIIFSKIFKNSNHNNFRVCIRVRMHLKLNLLKDSIGVNTHENL